MTDIPDGLLHYFRSREQSRGDAFRVHWDALTLRERQLVKEAAVMGYVRGSMHGAAGSGHRPDPIPGDSTIVYEVVDACISMPDIYPLLGGDVGD